MEWNWGTKLVMGMVSFMTFIVVLAVMMFNSKPDALVDNDYYEKGLNYNADYNLKEQVKADHAAPEILILPGEILLKFKAAAEGKVKIVRPSDKRMDKVVNFKTDAAYRSAIPSKEIAKGRWKLIITWNSAGKSYLDEQEVMVK